MSARTGGNPSNPGPREVVEAFYSRVRSGLAPEEAGAYLAPRVLAHQVVSELTAPTIVRDPADYAEHVREMRALFGAFDVTIEEILADGPKVFVRWRQDGYHIASHEGEHPTGTPLVQRGSAVYRVEGGRIAEYWIQVEAAGVRAQIDRALARD